MAYWLVLVWKTTCHGSKRLVDQKTSKLEAVKHSRTRRKVSTESVQSPNSYEAATTDVDVEFLSDGEMVASSWHQLRTQQQPHAPPLCFSSREMSKDTEENVHPTHYLSHVGKRED